MAHGVRQLTVYLIKPSKYDDDGYVIRYWRGVLPSNTLACLYGLTDDVRRRQVLGRLRWRIELIDEGVQKVDVRGILRASRRPQTKVVVCLVGVQSNQFARASDLALALRAGGVDVLIGGFHVSGSLAMLPSVPPEIRRLLEAGATVVAGEIEGRWESLLRDALQGHLKPIYNFLSEPPDLGTAPMPQISRRYLKRFVSPNFGTLDCGRGCPFNCSFCTVINVQGRAMRVRDPARLISLIRDNYHRHRISYYFFTDDNFCRNRHWETLLDALIRLRREEGLPLRFMAQVDTQSYKLPRFVEKASAAGCSQVFIGLESLNPKNLEASGKRQNLLANFQEMMAAYRQVGINTHIAYIIGFPFDTVDSVRQDVKRLKDALGPEQASFFMLTPLPGSRDHVDWLRRGEPLDPDLNNYDSFRATTSHPQMTREEWLQAYQEAWTVFYGQENMKAILKRLSGHNYWGAFSLFIWYKNSVEVEEGHPMLCGFFRLKGRHQRRSGLPLESRRQYARRRLRDAMRYVRLWPKLVLEMEEVWLQTRPRSELEQRVVDELERRYADMKQWRDLRLAELQHVYRRAAILFRRTAAGRQARPRIAIPSRIRLWVKRQNPFSHSLIYSRRSLQRFWGEALRHLARGRLDCIDVYRVAFSFVQEMSLFICFLSSYLRQSVPYFLGRLAPARR